MQHVNFMVPYNISWARLMHAQSLPVPSALNSRDKADMFKLFERVSRSMSVGVNIMDDPLKSIVAIAYLVCKLADGAEDVVPDGTKPEVTIYHQWRVRLLITIRDYVNARHQGKPGNMALVRNWSPVSQADEAHRIALLHAEQICDFMMLLPSETRGVIVFWTTAMLNGMIWGVDRKFRFATDSELEHYSWAVAGTVGYMLTELVALYSAPGSLQTIQLQQLHESAENFGILLQETNYLRNLAQDSTRLGHSFVSLQMCEDWDITPETLCLVENRGKALNVVNTLCQHIFNRSRRALHYIDALPQSQVGVSLRRFSLFSLLMATRTASHSLNDPRVLDSRSPDIKVTREEVHEIYQAAIASACDPAAQLADLLAKDCSIN